MIDRVSFFNGNALKTTAITERITADACHTARNRESRKIATLIERTITNARDAVCDDYCFDAISVAVPRHRRTIIIRHLPCSANGQRFGHGIKRPCEIIPLCAAGAAIGCGRRGQNEKRRQRGDKDD